MAVTLYLEPIAGNQPASQLVNRMRFLAGIICLGYERAYFKVTILTFINKINESYEKSH